MRFFALFYSNLSESTVFFRAEFIVTPLTVEKAIIRTIAPVRMNIHPPTNGAWGKMQVELQLSGTK